MPKRYRGGYVFVGWKGDHSPRHVKWDLENSQPMNGSASGRVKRLIKELVDEGLL